MLILLSSYSWRLMRWNISAGEYPMFVRFFSKARVVMTNKAAGIPFPETSAMVKARRDGSPSSKKKS